MNTQPIWWWKFPFSAIAKAGFDLFTVHVSGVGEGLKTRDRKLLKNFSHCWIHSSTQKNNFTHSRRRPPQLHQHQFSRRKPQTNIKQSFEWFPWRCTVWLKTLKRRDFRAELSPIKGAPFWRFSFCLSVDLVQVKSGKEKRVPGSYAIVD